jgi:hypothetical protein
MVIGQAGSARKEFFYFNDDGDLVGLRYENWKVVCEEQRSADAPALGDCPPLPQHPRRTTPSGRRKRQP